MFLYQKVGLKSICSNKIQAAAKQGTRCTLLLRQNLWLLEVTDYGCLLTVMKSDPSKLLL